MSEITLLSGRYFIALKALKKRLTACLAWGKPTPRCPHIREVNDHLARDIGLSPTERARHQHRFPSQTQHHPRG